MKTTTTSPQALPAKGALLLTKLQRTEFFGTGAPVLWPAAPLLSEAEQWLCAVEHALPGLAAADILDVTANYDLLHRLARRRPGTPLLRRTAMQILSPILNSPSGALRVRTGELPTIVDACRLYLASGATDREEEVKAVMAKALARLNDAPEFEANATYPEKIARVRVLMEAGMLDVEDAIASLLPLYRTVGFAPAPVLHQLLKLTVRLKARLRDHFNVDAALHRIQTSLAKAPDNHPLDRQARRQQLDNEAAFRPAGQASQTIRTRQTCPTADN